MGPRSGDRGNMEGKMTDSEGEKASMGPRSDDRGNGQVVGYLALSAALQWGRDLVIAEMERSRPGHQRRFSRFNGAAIW